MRVLHLPVNNGSRTSHTIRALRELGVDARGLVRTRTAIQSPKGLDIIDLGSKLGSRYSPRLLRFGIPWLYNFLKLVHWADIVHWYSGAMALPLGLDLAIIKLWRKPGLVEWQGAEIRIPEVEFADNPYYTAVYGSGYEYQRYESLNQSRRLQKRFADAGFACSAPTGMLQYVQRDIFPVCYSLPRRLILSEYQPAYPSPATSRPLVIHSPSAPITKGTAAVLRAIEELQSRCSFEFRLIQGMTRDQLLEIMSAADIVLDQFVLGDYGSISLEAMALGKPVVCYIKPSLVAQYPPDLPLVKATQHDLADVLEPLIKDGRWRHEMGQRGRAYVEEHNDASQVATRLREIYAQLLPAKKR
jgi:hypothetical protein